MRKLLSLSVAALLGPALVGCADDLPVATSSVDAPRSNASAPTMQEASVHWLSDLSEVDDGTARLTRRNSSVSFSFRTTGLEKGHAITIWWVIFNNPDACTHPNATIGSRCDAPDLGNPDVEASVLWAAGNLAGQSGRSGFGGHLKEGEVTTFHPAFVGSPGLVDAGEAEIHLVLRTHGPLIQQLAQEMLQGSFAGGCTPETSGGFGDGPNACANLQAAAFPAP